MCDDRFPAGSLPERYVTQLVFLGRKLFEGCVDQLVFWWRFGLFFDLVTCVIVMFDLAISIGVETSFSMLFKDKVT